MVKTATSPSVTIYMPMARELLPGMGEQTLKDEVKKMGGALNKPVLLLSNTSEDTKITRSNGKIKKATILIHREQLLEDVLSQLDCSKMLQCASIDNKVLIWFYLFLYIVCHHNPDDITTIVQHVDVPPVPLHPPKFLPLLAVPNQTTGILDDSVTASSVGGQLF